VILVIGILLLNFVVVLKIFVEGSGLGSVVGLMLSSL